jgi:predicted PurR-regulated permease PerM
MNVSTTRRYRAPRSTGFLVALATAAGLLAVVATVIAVLFAADVSDVADDANRAAKDAQRALAQVTRNRPEVLETLCLEDERLKADLRSILRRFGVSRSELPAHADGSRALDPVAGGCAFRAQELVDPPPPDMP